MTQPYSSKPNPVTQRLYDQANEAWEEQDYQKSIGLFEKISRKQPHNPKLLLDVALAYGKRYDFSAAERYIEKAVQISNDQAMTLGDAGQICLEFANIDMAVRCLQRASRKKNVSIGSLMNLVDIYLRDKRLDEAAELVARAEQMNRKDPRVLLEHAVLEQLRGNVTEAESVLRELQSNPRSDASARIRALYELAGILDKKCQYDEAMTALLEAKAL